MTAPEAAKRKKCTKCGETKPVAEFYRKKNARDGRDVRCAKCVRAYMRQWISDNAQRYEELRQAWWARRAEQLDAYRRAYRRAYNQRPEVRAFYQRRKITHLKARPRWIEECTIIAIYAERDAITARTRIPYEVDHLYPLRHREFCGLDVPWNLRVIPASENGAKSNKRPDEFYSAAEFAEITHQLNNKVDTILAV